MLKIAGDVKLADISLQSDTRYGLTITKHLKV